SFKASFQRMAVVLVPKVLASRGLADRFHDHVVEKTIDDWRYWVFTNIMGHFVHSFDREVDASSISTLKESNAPGFQKMSLHQLRK
ncbi:ChREBP2, partial [Caligus rogercresseyi]